MRCNRKRDVRAVMMFGGMIFILGFSIGAGGALAQQPGFDESSDRPTVEAAQAPCFGDDRTQLDRDSRLGIGRINTSLLSCTAFILSNGAFLTAGHCVDSDNDEVIDPSFLAGSVQFNVPDSSSVGCITTDGNTRSYPIDAVIDYQLIRYFGLAIAGKDWAVFSVGSDAFGVEPGMVEGFLRPDDAAPPPFATLRVTGYGNDTHPSNSGLCGTTPSDGNSSAFTLQTHMDILQKLTLNEIRHRVDTQSASSGSPIIRESTGRAIGIHNTSLCSIEAFNVGVAFTKNNLADAINGFQGPNAVHLDAAAASGGDGSAFEPFDGLDEAVDATPVGGTLVIVAGSHSGSTTIDKHIDIVTPVGGVTLGD